MTVAFVRKHGAALVAWMLTVVGVAGWALSDSDGWRNLFLCMTLAGGPAALWALSGRSAALPLRIGTAAGLMTWLVVSGRMDPGLLLERAGERRGFFVVGMVLVMTQPVWGAVRWHLLLRVQDVDVTPGQTLRLTMIGHFFNICLPGAVGGDVVRVYAVAKERGHAPEVTTTIFLDRFTGMVALFGICGAALLFNMDFVMEGDPGFREAVIALAAALCIGVGLPAALMNRALPCMLRNSRFGDRHFPGREALGRAWAAFHAYHGSRPALAGAVAVSVPAHLCTIAGGWCFGRALGIDELGFANYMLLVPMGLAVNAIPFTPGGVGQGQVGFHYLFKRALPGVAGAGELGALVMTAIHLSVFAVAFVGGVLYAAAGHGLRKAVRDAAHAETDDAPGGDVAPGGDGEASA